MWQDGFYVRSTAATHGTSVRSRRWGDQEGRRLLHIYIVYLVRTIVFKATENCHTKGAMIKEGNWKGSPAQSPPISTPTNAKIIQLWLLCCRVAPWRSSRSFSTRRTLASAPTLTDAFCASVAATKPVSSSLSVQYLESVYSIGLSKSYNKYTFHVMSCLSPYVQHLRTYVPKLN